MQLAASSLDALGNPTRRALLDQLARGPRPVSALAQGLPISRPAVSQQLRILEQAHLVQVQVRGRQRIYSLRPDGFVAARSWMEGLWPVALERFAALADTTWEPS